MGLFDPLVNAGLAQVEKLEQSLGSNAALPLWEPFLQRDDPAIRVRARLGKLRCLVRLRMAEEVIAEAEWWGSVRGGQHLDEIIDLCKALVAQRNAKAAAALAQCECRRNPIARAIYLYARCLEEASDTASMELFELAAREAESEPGAAVIGVAARVRRIECFAKDPKTLPQAIEEAQRADPEQGSAAHKLVIAAARLASPSSFRRASGLSILEDLAKKGRAEIADAAVRMAARHADAHADGLSAVEADRMFAILKHWRDPKESESAAARLRALMRIAQARGEDQDRAVIEAAEVAPETFALLCRARAVLTGGGQGSYAGGAGSSPSGSTSPSEVSSELVLGGLGLDIVVALRRERASDAASALARASVALRESSGSAPPAIWTGASLGLRSADRGVRDGAVALVEILLTGKAAPPPPPVIKLGPLAASLRLLDRADLAAIALRGAAATKEPGAAADLAQGLAREGWRLAERGDREAALAALREARGLLRKGERGEGAGPSGPRQNGPPA